MSAEERKPEISESSQTEAVQSPVATVAPKRKASRVVILVVLLVIAGVLGAWYIHSLRSEDTDDAQVDGHLIPITSRIEGTVVAVRAEDNQPVDAGAVLVELDRRDAKVAIAQATAQFDQANAQVLAAGSDVPLTRFSNQAASTGDAAQVSAAQASLAVARQDLAAAQARLRQSQVVSERAQADMRRYQSLFDKNEVARAEYEQRKADAAAEEQVVVANQAGVESSARTVEQKSAQVQQQQSTQQEASQSAPLRIAIKEAEIKGQRANAEAAQATLMKAKNNLGDGTIVAPVAGVVTQRNVEPGSRISPGQQLMMIVQTSDLWVTANFKETQIARMQPKQRVRIRVDGLNKEFDGAIESLPAITGARTSVLPPENATGNYVKVIQRMSVRIRFTPGQAGLEKLRPGMSVEPRVSVE